MPAADPSKYPPPAIPDHQMLGVIGRGSYGEVWLARNVLGTWRAVKVIRRDAFNSPKPFEREFTGIQRFEPVSRSHNGLIDVLQVGRNDEAGFFYCVMELADPVSTGAGGVPPPAGTGSRPPTPAPPLDPAVYAPRTLAADLAARGRLPAAECAVLFHDLAEALHHLHEAGLVHRDIKPSNIIFVGGQAKFADIGLVVSRDDTHSHVGTEGYIPPEGSGSPAADIYALGKVLYEAVTGRDRMEFPALPDDADDLTVHAGLLELNAVLVRACAPNPRDRHPDAAGLARDLALLRSGHSVKAARRRERRRLALPRVALGATLLLGIVAGLAWWRHQPHTRAGAGSAAANGVELLARARQLRAEAAPGWRTAALDALTHAAALRPTAELRQEMIHALAGSDLRPLAWTPRNAGQPVAVDLAHDRYVTTTPGGILLFHALKDHAELMRMDRAGENLPIQRFGDFSPDGEWLSLWGADHVLRFRHAAPGEGAWGVLPADPAAGTAFNPGHTMVAFSPTPHTVRLCDTAAVTSRFRDLKFEATLVQFAWSHDGHTFAVLGREPDHLQLLESPSGRETARWELDASPTRLEWLPDDSGLLIGTRTGLSILRPGAPAAHPTSLMTNIAVLALATDDRGRLVVTAEGDGQVRVRDVATGRPLAAALATGTTAVQFAPGARTVAIAGSDPSRVSLFEFSYPAGLVQTLAPAAPAGGSPDGSAGLRAVADGVALDAGTNGIITLPTPARVTAATWASGRDTIRATLEDHTALEWNVARLRERLATLGLGW